MTTLEQLNRPLRKSKNQGEFIGKLRDVNDCAVDTVAAQSAVTASLQGSSIHAEWTCPDGTQPLLLPSGVYYKINGTWSDTALRQVAERLNVPPSYLLRIAHHGDYRAQDLACTTINTMSLVHDKPTLFRWWRAEDGWQLRAVLSRRFQAIDNWEVLRAVAEGMGAADQALMDCEVDVDWTDTRFRMRIAVPAVAHACPDLLADYRSPFLRPGEDAPVLWAGIEVTNSETGHGAFSVAPRAVVMKCRNGLTEGINFRRTHIGASLEEGVVDWSDQTRQSALRLVESQVTDAVRTFVSPTYLSGLADRMRRAKATEVGQPTQVMELLRQQHTLTDSEADQMLSLFVRGNEPSVLGLGHAITALAADAADGDRQAELEAAFWSIVDQPQRYSTTR